jgi:PAS domain S-box-containing protein
MSFIRKMIQGWVLCQLLVLVIVGPVAIYVLQKHEKAHLQDMANATMELVIAASRDLIVAGDLQSLEHVSKQIITGPDVDFVQFLDNDGHVLVEAGMVVNANGTSAERALSEIDYLDFLWGLETYNQTKPIIISGLPFGEVRVGHSLHSIDRQVLVGTLLIFAVSLSMAIAAIIFSVFMGRSLQSGLLTLEDGARRVATGEVGIQVALTRPGVLTSTIDAFNTMSRRLKETYERAVDSEQNLRDAIESIPDAFCVYDRNDKLLLCNSRYARLLETSGMEAIVGAKFEDLVRSGLAKGVFDVPEDEKQQWLEDYVTEHRKGNVSREIRMTSGRWIRVEEHKTERGHVIGFRLDITELKEREQAYRISEGRLRTTIEAALDCIICIDKNGYIVDFNGAAERTFGYQREEVLGSQMGPLIIPPAYRDLHERGMKRYVETGEGPLLGKRIEVVAMRRDGTEFPCELALEASGDGDDILIVGTMRDITEQRKQSDALHSARERAEAANKAKDEFLAMMTHEIRTPLNGVIGILGLLQDTVLDKEQLEYVRAARTSGDILLQILNDILDYSKMDAGKLELEEAPLRLAALIEPVAQILAPRVDAKKLDFRVDIAPNLAECIVGDIGRIRQVLLNLANNAVKFTEDGYVSISATKVDTIFGEPKAGIMFEVTDTGVGIPEEKHDQLFVEFNQLDASYARKFGGTGLGLAICRELVELMGGLIDFRSTFGEGSTFYFTIPLIVGDPSELEEETDSTIIIDQARSCRVLVAEDNATNSMIVKLMLEKAGHRVDTAMDGEEAVQAVKSLPYDVVFMDVNMPEMDGFQATRHIRELPAPRCDVPIIALTALAMEGDKKRVLDSGMDGYMTKPVSRQQLLMAVQRSAGTVLETAVDAENATDAGGSEHALVDQAVIKKLGEDTDPELVPELLSLYIDDTKRRLEKLEAAIGVNEIAAIEHETHTMASSAAMHGAMKLFGTARAAEEQCRDGDQAVALNLAKQVVEIATATFDELQNVILAKTDP